MKIHNFTLKKGLRVQTPYYKVARIRKIADKSDVLLLKDCVRYNKLYEQYGTVRISDVDCIVIYRGNKTPFDITYYPYSEAFKVFSPTGDMFRSYKGIMESDCPAHIKAKIQAFYDKHIKE
jgi:hypothetical protein